MNGIESWRERISLLKLWGGLAKQNGWVTSGGDLIAAAENIERRLDEENKVETQVDAD